MLFSFKPADVQYEKHLFTKVGEVLGTNKLVVGVCFIIGIGFQQSLLNSRDYKGVTSGWKFFGLLGENLPSKTVWQEMHIWVCIQRGQGIQHNSGSSIFIIRKKPRPEVINNINEDWYTLYTV